MTYARPLAASVVALAAAGCMAPEPVLLDLAALRPAGPVGTGATSAPTPAPVQPRYSTAPPPPPRSGWNPFLVVAIIVGIVVLLTCTGMVMVIAFADSSPAYESPPIELPPPDPLPDPPPEKG